MKRSLLIVAPDNGPFRALAAYGQSFLKRAFEPIAVVVHGHSTPQSDFELRRRRVGLLRALDERLYCLIESLLTPWARAANRLGLKPCHDSFPVIPSLRDPEFENFVKVGGYDFLLGLGCEYIPVDMIPRRITALNIHPGIMPRYRGLGNPEAWLRGDFGTMGVTIHRMTTRLDAGPILARRLIAGMKRLDIPLSYLLAYKVGINVLPAVVADACSASAPLSDKGGTAAVNLWRMRSTLFIIGTLRSMRLQSFAFRGFGDRLARYRCGSCLQH